MRARWCLLLLPLSSCALFDIVKDSVDGLTNSTFGLGIVTRVAAPESDLVDLSETDIQLGIGATVFLADAADVADIENAPISGRAVSVDACGETADLSEDASGAYLLVPGEAFSSCGNTSAVLQVLATDDATDDEVVLPVEIPEAPDVTVAEMWTAGEAMTLDLSGADVDQAIAMVIDLESGDITWSNQPDNDDVMGWFDLLRGNAPETIEIPGDAFPADAVLAVGLTVMQKTAGAELTGVNTVLSNASGALLTFFPVSTLVIPDEVP